MEVQGNFGKSGKAKRPGNVTTSPLGERSDCRAIRVRGPFVQNKRRPCEAPSNEPALKSGLESLRAGNRGDVAPVEADVAELAGIEAAELADGAAIVGELVELLTNVHFIFPFLEHR